MLLPPFVDVEDEDVFNTESEVLLTAWKNICKKEIILQLPYLVKKGNSGSHEFYI
jgi:hypothetical protein